jgi:hypothetical protein
MKAYKSSTGIAHRNVRGQLYPIVGLGHTGATVRVTFGLPAPVKPNSVENEVRISPT